MITIKEEVREQLIKKWENGIHFLCHSKEDIDYLRELFKYQKDPKGRLETDYSIMFQSNNWVCFTMFYEFDENEENLYVKPVSCIDAYIWSDKMNLYTTRCVFVEDVRLDKTNIWTMREVKE